MNKYKPVTDIKITRYESGDFWVDIIDKPDVYEAWLSHKKMGVSDMMFGECKHQPVTEDPTYESFVDDALYLADEYKLYYMIQYDEEGAYENYE